MLKETIEVVMLELSIAELRLAALEKERLQHWQKCIEQRRREAHSLQTIRRRNGECQKRFYLRKKLARLKKELAELTAA